MGKLILIRHGQSTWNLENRFTGFRDVPLTVQGETEAHAGGEKIKASGLMPDAVFTSTLKRAWHTAELVLAGAGLNLPLVKSDDLRERDYGDLSGLNKAEAAKQFGEEQVHIWRRSYDVPPPGGESLADVVARVKPYYEKHIAPELVAGETVLIAAHGNSLRALMVVLDFYTQDNINTFEIPNGEPLIVEFVAGAPTQYYYL